MRRHPQSEKVAICGINGGGGSRTRVAVPADSSSPQHLSLSESRLAARTAHTETPADRSTADGFLGFAAVVIAAYAVCVLVDVFAHGQVIAWPF